MGGVLSSTTIVVDAASRATGAAADADWASLPDDLLFTIMSRLDIQSISRAGAVCTSWHHAHDAFRLPAAPCLLYACNEYGPNDVAMYCPTTGITFRVPFPGPPHDKRGFTFSCTGGWVFTTNEVGDPYLINPLTGVQATLPPVKTIYHNDTYYDDGGKHVWDADPEVPGSLPTISWARAAYGVWRNWDDANTRLTFHDTYQDIMEEIYEDCVELAGEDESKAKLSELNTKDEVHEEHEAVTTDREIDASQILREGIDLPHRLEDEVTTISVLVFKVDIKRQKLVELRDIGDHALFVGRNCSVCLPTKDYPVFQPNCAYLTDDCFENSPMLRNDLGIWNIEKRTMQKLRDAWPEVHPWLHLPAPIWIMPKL
ncbi:unnamed protein product [Alopecurus aequalis]